MSQDNFFVKGDPHNILMRIEQIHTITIYCPLIDTSISYLYESFGYMMEKYRKTNNLWKNVPAIDALNVFIVAKTFCNREGLNLNNTAIEIIIGALKSFPNLKKINFEFSSDKELMGVYSDMITKKKKPEREIYKIELVEMNLSNMFSQTVIDIFNKVMMFSEIIPNSYLNRKFKIDFTFDEYMNFINMMVNNNENNFNMMDKNICNYFRMFPPRIIDDEPIIRVITNYEDL